MQRHESQPRPPFASCPRTTTACGWLRYHTPRCWLSGNLVAWESGRWNVGIAAPVRDAEGSALSSLGIAMPVSNESECYIYNSAASTSANARPPKEADLPVDISMASADTTNGRMRMTLGKRTDGTPARLILHARSPKLQHGTPKDMKDDSRIQGGPRSEKTR
ncbi:hypothetical protein EK21DRAFT_83756 [Setomelanomma holmii]|uniref:Uncharacterized protein n=1 Tax=Setomelanomma holmii TaxID=210430 RepID=A0A9P4LQC7_9PLEO|nr:hypothetical protein EK21DRAFT_83756 [Setomelanomma holmii]